MFGPKNSKMVVPRSPLLQRRFLCTKVSKNLHKWSIKQVTKSNFSESLDEIKTHISLSDFVAVSLQKTGSFSAPWHRVLPFDTSDTAYSKAKYAAERFQLIQFALCPFSVRASKVVAHPYNFHLFPRDELKVGMPSYSFSCQTSYLASMAREGFDFNLCIYDGISYLSRSQESAAKDRIGNPIHINHETKFSSSSSVADAVFIERIKSRVKHWRNACKDSSKKADEALVRSLRNLVLGSEEYGSRPCLTIDVCSERQVQLTLEMLGASFDDLVPLIIPAKGGGTQAVRVVLTSTKEDKDLLEGELKSLEEAQNKRVRGFREVIDLISASQKPVVSHNFLNDFTFIHSKFLSPLPSNMDDFMRSLHLVFPQIIDVNHLMKEIGPMKAMTNLPTAISYLKGRFFSPIDMEIPNQAKASEGKIHGNNALRITHLFAKLCSILKINLDSLQSKNGSPSLFLSGHESIFNPSSASPPEANDEDIQVWTNNTKKVSCANLVFLWGFRSGLSGGVLKRMLQGSHEIFNEEFDVRLVDKSCAIIVFWKPGFSDVFLEVMGSKDLCGIFKEMVSEGMRATGYETYSRVCRLGLWRAELGDSLDEALAEPDSLVGGDPQKNTSEIYWSSDMIYFDEL